MRFKLYPFAKQLLSLAFPLSYLCSSHSFSQTVELPLATPETELALNTNILETMVVTSTREAKLKSNLAESVSVLDSGTLEQISPSHPAEALNRIAGVHINNLGGEGHMSAIRQPITTKGVYLFLEDGVPTRPTGYFNHNGLYEINIPQSSRLEVTKGPGSALYGSDAIGGVINSVTKASPEEKEVDVNLEAGRWGWKRSLVSFGTPLNDEQGIRVDLNVTDNSGYRDASDYQRISSTIRHDYQVHEDLTYPTSFYYL